MKRVCTLRKVLPLGFKGPLRKVIFYRSYISWLFITTQFLSSLKYLQPGDMPWNRNLKYLHKKKFFLNFIATFATRILTCWYTVA